MRRRRLPCRSAGGTGGMLPIGDMAVRGRMKVAEITYYTAGGGSLKIRDIAPNISFVNGWSATP